MPLNSKVVRSKTGAFMKHLLLTLLVAGLSAVLVFQVWYPQHLWKMVGGIELYFLMLSVELTLGPVMSLVIFHPNKSRKELVRDYLVIGVIQMSALVYGLYVVAQSRPVFLVFVKDRIEVITPVEIAAGDLAQGHNGFDRLPWFGPQRICVSSPSDVDEQNRLLFSAVFNGKDIQNYPQYYRSCLAGRWLEKAYADDQLRELVKEKNSDILLPNSSFSWLPVRHRFGVWVEIYPADDTEQAHCLPFDPFNY
jgi:hypothetical protein